MASLTGSMYPSSYPTAKPSGMNPDASAEASARRNLLHVLGLLEQRGVSADAMAMAMARSGISPDIAQLLSRFQLQATPPTNAVADRQRWREATAAEHALKALASGFFLWIGIFGLGLVGGLLLGYEIGVVQGFDAGLDRAAAWLDQML